MPDIVDIQGFSYVILERRTPEAFDAMQTPEYTQIAAKMRARQQSAYLIGRARDNNREYLLTEFVFSGHTYYRVIHEVEPAAAVDYQ